MKNTVIRAIMHELSLDNYDLSNAEIADKKQAVKAARPDCTALFTQEYFDNSPWLFFSLKTLMGYSSEGVNWVNKAVRLYDQQHATDKQQILYIDCTVGTQGGATQKYDANITGVIEIAIPSSPTDLSISENIVNRLIHYSMPAFAGVSRLKTDFVHNNVKFLNFGFAGFGAGDLIKYNYNMHLLYI